MRQSSRVLGIDTKEFYFRAYRAERKNVRLYQMIEPFMLDRVEGSLISSHETRMRPGGALYWALCVAGVLFFAFVIYLTAEPEVKSNDRAMELARMHLHNDALIVL